MRRPYNRSKLLIIGILVLSASAFFAVHSASATTYYVAQNGGSDSNPCAPDDASKAKQTIHAGIACVNTAAGAAAGITVEVASGTYVEGSLSNYTSVSWPSGTSWNSPFKLTAKSGGTVTIKTDGSGDGSNISIYFYGDPNRAVYIIINGFIFDGANMTGGSSVGIGSCCDVPGSVRISNNEFINTNHGMAFLGGGNGGQFIGNKIHGGTFDCPVANCIGGNYGYPVYRTGSNSLIEGNEIYDFPSFGFHIYDHGKPQNNIVRNNSIHDFGWAANCPSDARCLGKPADGRGNGILLDGSGHVAYNNLVYNGKYGISLYGGCINCQAYNNTVYNLSSGGITVDSNTSNASVRNNIVYQSAGNIINNAGSATVSNNLTGDPQFINAAGGDFHLTSNSTSAIDQGAVIPGVTDGYVGSAPDIGACEYGDSNCPRGGGGSSVPSSSGSFCSLFDSSSAVPSGFGASFNLFSSAKELLMKAFCNTSSADYTVGNGAQTEYIYKTGYYWSGTAWTPYTYSGSSMSSDGNWFIGNASYIRTNVDLSTKQSFIAYICDWNGSAWHCGCHDSSCSTPFWNLQQFKQ
jgi:Right handed beta helix region